MYHYPYHLFSLYITQDLTGSTIVPYQGASIDLTPPWRRVPMNELVQVHLSQIPTPQSKSPVKYLRALTELLTEILTETYPGKNRGRFSRSHDKQRFSRGTKSCSSSRRCC